MPPRGKKRARFEVDIGEDADAAEAAPAEPATETEAIIQNVLKEDDMTKEQLKARKPQEGA